MEPAGVQMEPAGVEHRNCVGGAEAIKGPPSGSWTRSHWPIG